MGRNSIGVWPRPSVVVWTPRSGRNVHQHLNHLRPAKTSSSIILARHASSPRKETGSRAKSDDP